MAQELWPVVITALEGGIAAAVYAAFWYARARKKGEQFEPYRFGATLLVGAAAGVVLAVSGLAVTETAVQNRLAAYVGVVSLAEAALKWLGATVGVSLPRKG